jgi:AbiV family abortive infection protein
MKLASPLSPKILQTRDACLQNADDMLTASRSVLEQKLYNIAYHLAVIALEEIGKACMLGMSGVKEYQDGEGDLKFIDDHIKKIFWALFDLSFIDKPLTKQALDNNNHIAHVIHDMRLKSMYVDMNETGISTPCKTITIEQAESLINLAAARLEMEKAHQFKDLDDEKRELLDWLLRIKDDPVWSKFVFSRQSMEKLAEYQGQSKKWILWLKEIFDKQMEESRLLAEAEINKPEPSSDEKKKDKWRIKIRLYCQSHSIRQKTFNRWNEICQWVKIKYGGDAKKNDFLVEFTLPNAVSVNSLYYAAWGLARKFVVAMNIGTMGYVWWSLPKYVDKFYCEKIFDIENKHSIDLLRSPSLSVDWGKRVISENDIMNVAVSFSCIPEAGAPHIRIFDYYYGGLTFLGMNDINYQCEDTAFANFYLAIKEAVKYYHPDVNDIPSHLANVFGQETSDDLDKMIKLGEDKINETSTKENYNLGNTIYMKIICDGYLLKQFKRLKHITLEAN